MTAPNPTLFYAENDPEPDLGLRECPMCSGSGIGFRDLECGSCAGGGMLPEYNPATAPLPKGF